jgi:hypothetical protein
LEWRHKQADAAGRKLIAYADKAHLRMAATSHKFMDENGIAGA